VAVAVVPRDFLGVGLPARANMLGGDACDVQEEARWH
jgi:hypothetical protein